MFSEDLYWHEQVNISSEDLYWSEQLNMSSEDLYWPEPPTLRQVNTIDQFQAGLGPITLLVLSQM
jgi:hypothetical protein